MFQFLESLQDFKKKSSKNSERTQKSDQCSAAIRAVCRMSIGRVVCLGRVHWHHWKHCRQISNFPCRHLKFLSWCNTEGTVEKNTEGFFRRAGALSTFFSCLIVTLEHRICYTTEDGHKRQGQPSTLMDATHQNLTDLQAIFHNWHILTTDKTKHLSMCFCFFVFFSHSDDKKNFIATVALLDNPNPNVMFLTTSCCHVWPRLHQGQLN